VTLILYLSHVQKWAGIAQLVKGLATGWTVRGSNSGGAEIFRTHVCIVVICLVCIVVSCLVCIVEVVLCVLLLVVLCVLL